jgi:hypothetical protein
MPATLTAIIAPPVPAPVPPAVVIAIMAVMIARRHNQHRVRPVKRRMHNDRPGMNRARHEHHRRRAYRPGGDDHWWRINGPGHHHDRRCAQRRRRRDHHPGRRWEAEGDAEVEVRPRRGGNRESQGEGTDAEYGFGFHNASTDAGRRRRFEHRPLIELIAPSTTGNQPPNGANCGNSGGPLKVVDASGLFAFLIHISICSTSLCSGQASSANFSKRKNSKIFQAAFSSEAIMANRRGSAIR